MYKLKQFFKEFVLILRLALQRNKTKFEKAMQPKAASPILATTNNILDAERRGLITGNRVSLLCSQLCCKCPPPPLPKSSSSDSLVTLFVNENSTELETKTNTTKKIGTSEVLKFERRIVTKTTSTVIVTKPVEFILNDRKEIVSKFENIYSNSLGCVLSDIDNNSVRQKVPSFPINDESVDFKYIDDISMSCSEIINKNRNINEKDGLYQTCEYIFQHNRSNTKQSQKVRFFF